MAVLYQYHEDNMIEQLKNIGVGLWCLNIMVATLLGLGYLLITFPTIALPILVLIVAWTIGKFLR